METKQKKAKVVVIVLALAGFLMLPLFTVGGNLEPSAPPGPTMKTLDEVEPRIPIRADDLPLVITEPNSYYLVESVNFTNTVNHAITINCDNVTIDLMGYSLIGPSLGTGCGIYMNGRCHVEIHNGKIEGFGSHGIVDENFIDPDPLDGKGHRIVRVRSVSNGAYGIYLATTNNLVKDCTVGINGDNGISTESGSTVTGNTVYENHGYGIRAGSGSKVTGNTVYKNMEFWGIVALDGSTVTGNSVEDNQGKGIEAYSGSTVSNNSVINNEGNGINVNGGAVIGNSVYGNQGSGIWVDDSTVTSNTVMNNQGFGIRASESMVNGNTVISNGESGTDAGIVALTSCFVRGNTVSYNTPYNIRVSGMYTTIEGNLVTGEFGMGTGIYVSNTDNLIIKNKASNHTTNYNIAAGNAYGQIINVAGVGSFVNNDPTANFAY